MFKKIIFYCFAAFIFCISCANKQEPDFLLPEKQMVEILTDCYLVESSVRQEGTPLKVDEMKNYYQEVFKKHGVTEEQFNKSYDYYCHDLEKADKIYEKVLEKLYL